MSAVVREYNHEEFEPAPLSDMATLLAVPALFLSLMTFVFKMFGRIPLFLGVFIGIAGLCNIVKPRRNLGGVVMCLVPLVVLFVSYSPLGAQFIPQ